MNDNRGRIKASQFVTIIIQKENQVSFLKIVLLAMTILPLGALGQIAGLNLELSEKEIRAILSGGGSGDKPLFAKLSEEKRIHTMMFTSFCFSDHHGGSPKTSLYNEVNSCVGFAREIPFTPFGCKTFGEVGYVKKNSLQGESYTYGISAECEVAKRYFQGAPPLSFGLGVKHLYLRYKDPGILTKRQAEWGGWATFPFAYLSFGDWRLSASALGSKVTLYSLSYQF